MRLEDFHPDVAHLFTFRPFSPQGELDGALSGLEQLPHIEAKSFVLLYDHEWRSATTIIRLDDREILREVVQYEDPERFVEVAMWLKSKYGDRIKDLIPTPKSKQWLYGDRLGSPEVVAQARFLIFGAADSDKILESCVLEP